MKYLFLIGLILWSSCQTPEEKKTEGNMIHVLSQAKESAYLTQNNRVEMVPIKSGKYRAFYGKDAALVTVQDFELDSTPVTNAQYLRFVEQFPEWRKGAIASIRADSSYLALWTDPLVLGEKAPPNAPVVSISWFAAKAYCTCMGKRLPTMDEWEFVARADDKQPDARNNPAAYQRWLDWYSEAKKTVLPNIRHTQPNYWGVYDQYGLVWEWVSDFNAVLISGESRKDAKVDDSRLFCSGGSVGVEDLKNYAAFMRYAFRGSLKARYTIHNLGFRCAKSKTS